MSKQNNIVSNDGSEKATQPNTNENITEDINKSNSEENKNQPTTNLVVISPARHIATTLDVRRDNNKL